MPCLPVLDIVRNVVRRSNKICGGRYMMATAGREFQDRVGRYGAYLAGWCFVSLCPDSYWFDVLCCVRKHQAS